MSLASVTLFFALLILITVIYSMGVLTVAKLVGYRVIELSIGFGPQVLSLYLGATCVQLKLFPFGASPASDNEGATFPYLLVTCSG